ncbi:hypothetical protein CPB84DRAFT_1788362 [Gymnopilus junonius]|uniref:Transmembrane protein n=1 Tax=Gymnopilus junonius TaxID=109634 RepID=A0A9P5TKB5_GYMJU|nr:hypothetical protein CPB84DRAFT_1788362 [Gymnopilus junonius]
MNNERLLLFLFPLFLSFNFKFYLHLLNWDTGIQRMNVSANSRFCRVISLFKLFAVVLFCMTCLLDGASARPHDHDQIARARRELEMTKTEAMGMGTGMKRTLERATRIEPAQPEPELRTNAARMAAGLPPLRPKKLYYRHRPSHVRVDSPSSVVPSPSLTLVLPTQKD